MTRDRLLIILHKTTLESMTDIKMKCLQVGYLPTNCYVLVDKESREALVVDPGTRVGEANRVIHAINELGANVKFIVNTHGHPDHTSGNRAIKEHAGAKILIHTDDAPLLIEPWRGAEESEAFMKPHRCPVCGREEIVKLDVDADKVRTISECGVVVLEAELSPPADRTLRDKDWIKFGGIDIEVLHTPGHTRGGISLYYEKENLVFSGDTLFEGSWGRTDLAGSSEEEMINSLRRLGELPGQTVVYPGHGRQTTINKEKKVNPYM